MSGFLVHAILDLTIGFTSDGAEPRFWNVVNGKPVNAQIYARYVSASDYCSRKVQKILINFRS